jgi:hypothetical protein
MAAMTCKGFFMSVSTKGNANEKLKTNAPNWD